jgi:Rieske Fe-S protein
MSSVEVCAQMDNRTTPGRRAFLKTTVLTGVAAVLTGFPLLSYFIAPALNKGSGKWIDFGPADRLKPGEVEMLSYEFMVKDGWLVLPQRGFVWAKISGPEKITVFSSTCTHLACNVIWRKEKQIFECPCHSGHFDMDGHPMSGPPTKPLVVLSHKMEDGSLKVFMRT